MFKETAEGVTIAIHVIPNASKTEVVGVHNGAIKIKLNAPPVDGKANKAIIAFMAERLQIPKSWIDILKGDKSKQKILFVKGLSANQIKSALELAQE